MAFTRRFLKEVLADREDADELIDQIIDAHIETIAPLKAELSRLEEENNGKTADELRAEYERLTAELEQLKAEELDEDGTTWKTRYEEVKAEFEAAKAKEDARSAYGEKEKALRSLVLQLGAPHVVAELIVGARRDIVDSIDVQDGKVRNHERVVEAVRREYGSLIK